MVGKKDYLNSVYEKAISRYFPNFFISYKSCTGAETGVANWAYRNNK